MTKKIKIVFSIFFVASLIFTFFIPKPQLMPYPDYPNVPKDGRVFFQPFGNEFNFNQSGNLHQYSILLAPMHGNENIFPWYVLTPKDVGRTSTTYSIEKTLYDSLLQDSIKNQSNRHYELLKEGYVNYIVVNKNYKDFVEYYNSSSNFRVMNITDKYVIFELSPKASYIEVNGRNTENDLEKNIDKINIEFNCEIGNITVKETYSRNWVAFLNGKEVKPTLTENGFIELENNEIVGKCRLELIFREQFYYNLSVSISVITWFSISAYLAYIIFKQKMK